MLATLQALPSRRNSTTFEASLAKMPVFFGPPSAVMSDVESAVFVIAMAPTRPSMVSAEYSSVKRSKSAVALPTVRVCELVDFDREPS